MIRKRSIFSIIFSLLLSIVYAQSTDSLTYADSVFDAKKQMLELSVEAYTPGIIVAGDSIKFSAEFQKLLTDSVYRNAFYATGYSFEKVIDYLAQMKLQKACWQLINLYPENKELVIETLFAYSNLYHIDKILVYSVYTYAYFDPSISKTINGKPEIYRPDIMEEHLNRAKEIGAYINYYKKMADDQNEVKDSVK